MAFKNMSITKKIDIIIDNLQFEDKENNNRSVILNLSQTFKDENSINLYLDHKILSSLTDNEIKLIVVDYTDSSGSEKSTEIAVNEKVFKTSNGENYSYQEIKGVDPKTSLKIKILNIVSKSKENETKVLFKVRISNYKFYNETIDTFLNPTINLFHKILRNMLFYENDLHKNTVSQELLLLYTTRIFSGGIYQSEQDDLSLINSDYKTFMDEFSKLDKNKFEKYVDNFKPDVSAKQDHFYEFDMILEMKDEVMINLLKLTKIFDYAFKLVTKEFVFSGEIPDKLLRCIYLIILHHENLIPAFNEFFRSLHLSHSELFEKEDCNEDDIDSLCNIIEFNFFFLIWKVCSQIRKWYKAQKDELNRNLNDNSEDIIINYFAEVFKKLGFLYYLRKAESSNINYLEEFKANDNHRTYTDSFKLNSTTKKNTIVRKFTRIEEYSTLFKQKVNEHVHNIILISKTTGFTIKYNM